MKLSLCIWIVACGIALSIVGGCENAPKAEDANQAIKAMPAEQRFERIKADGNLSGPMKDRAIDNLPVSDDQKAKWKAELRQ